MAVKFWKTLKFYCTPNMTLLSEQYEETWYFTRVLHCMLAGLSNLFLVWHHIMTSIVCSDKIWMTRGGRAVQMAGFPGPTFLWSRASPTCAFFCMLHYIETVHKTAPFCVTSQVVIRLGYNWWHQWTSNSTPFFAILEDNLKNTKSY